MNAPECNPSPNFNCPSGARCIGQRCVYPTPRPTPRPTPSPTTGAPSLPSIPPTPLPTLEPTIPTTAPTPLPTNGAINFRWIYPDEHTELYIINNTFIRHQSVIRTRYSLDTGLDLPTIAQLASCEECFIWQYNPNNNGFVSLNSDSINIYNQLRNGRTIDSRLIINPTDTITDIYCLNDENNNTLLPGNSYEFRLMLDLTVLSQTVTLPNGFSEIVSISQSKIINTNETPKHGYCNIQNQDELSIFNTFKLNCNAWSSTHSNSSNIKYNALINGVELRYDFVNNASLLQGVVGVGDLDIIVLIKDEYGSITYYQLDETFPDIKNETGGGNWTVEMYVVELIDDLFWYINNDFINNLNFDLWLPEIISLYSVVQEFITWEFDPILFEPTLAVELLTAHAIIYSNNADRYGIRHILSELNVMSTLTSDENIVDYNSTNILITQYLSNLFSYINSEYLNSINDNYDELYSIAQQIEVLLTNLESILVYYYVNNLVINKDEIIDLYMLLIDYSTLTPSYALLDGYPGDKFYFDYNTYIKCTNNYNLQTNSYRNKTIFGERFIDRGLNETIICGDPNGQHVQLPMEFMDNSVFDCTFVETTNNLFVSDERPKLLTDIISIDVYILSADNNAPKLQTADIITDKCDPYFITININEYIDEIMQSISNYQLGKTKKFISCNFWNTSADWETTGCYVYNVSKQEGNIVCACEHLTIFGVTYKDFTPESNEIPIWNWRELTAHNLLKYPTVWMTILGILVIFIVLCFLTPKYRYRE
eukprot:531154_1